MRGRWALALVLPFLIGFEAGPESEALEGALHNLYGADLLAAVELVMAGDGAPPRSSGFAYARRRQGTEIRTLLFSTRGTRERALLLQEFGHAHRMFISTGSHRGVQPVATGQSDWRFCGSDFAYEDMRAHSSDEYRIDLLGSDVIEGEPARVLKLRPESGPYVMMLAWLSTERPVFLRVDYFDRHGLWKRYRVDVQEVRKHFEWWVPMRDEMLDLRTGRRTTRVIRNLLIDVDLPPELFTLTHLSRGRTPSF